MTAHTKYSVCERYQHESIKAAASGSAAAVAESAVAAAAVKLQQQLYIYYIGLTSIRERSILSSIDFLKIKEYLDEGKAYTRKAREGDYKIVHKKVLRKGYIEKF